MDLTEFNDVKKELSRILMNLDATSKPLWKDGVDITRKKLKNHTIKNYKKLTVNKKRISGKELTDHMFKIRKSKIFKIEKSLFLPPLEHDCEDNAFIPTLQCEWNFNKDKLSLYLEMYRLNEKQGVEGLVLHGIGFRFENPHEGSMHNYWHMQITNGRRNENLPEFPEWIPQNTPCFTMKASCPITLMCSMLISVYGSAIFKKMVPSLKIDGKYLELFKAEIG